MGRIFGASSRNPPSAHGPIPPLAGAGLVGGPMQRVPACVRLCLSLREEAKWVEKAPTQKTGWIPSGWAALSC